MIHLEGCRRMQCGLFKMLSQHLPGGTEKNSRRNLRQDSWALGRKSDVHTDRNSGVLQSHENLNCTFQWNTKIYFFLSGP
jgi:hypothetical protein